MDHANKKRGAEQGLAAVLITEQIHELEGSRERRCIFCREPMPESDEEADRQEMKRVKANDSVAMREVGMKCYTRKGTMKVRLYITQRRLVWEMLIRISN